MGFFYLIAWSLGVGVLLALWSLIYALQNTEDAYDYLVYLARAQRAFFLGCILGALISIVNPTVLSPLWSAIALSVAIILLTLIQEKQK